MNYGADLLLLAFLVTMVIRTKDDARVYAAFKALESTRARCLAFRRWTIESFLLYGIASLVALALLGELHNLISPPRVFIEYAQALKILASDGQEKSEPSSIGLIFGVAVLLGAGLGTVFALIWKRRRAVSQATALGDIEALLPRNSEERMWAFLISVNAGFSEELFFRLLLPLLLYRAFGNVLAAFVISILVFGCAHFYQGWKGVLATTAVGALFTAVYLGSGQIVYSMVLHAAMDINALIVMPALLSRVHAAHRE
jgi:membrane protease YdiL (CAAX protease family)